METFGDDAGFDHDGTADDGFETILINDPAGDDTITIVSDSDHSDVVILDPLGDDTFSGLDSAGLDDGSGFDSAVSGDTAALMDQINTSMGSVQDTVDWAESLPTDHGGSSGSSGGDGYWDHGIDQALTDAGIVPGDVSQAVLDQLRINEGILRNPDGAAAMSPLVQADIIDNQRETSRRQLDMTIGADDAAAAESSPF
jgi:hypothetical protein